MKRFAFERNGVGARPRIDREGGSSELLPEPLFASIEMHIAAGRELFGQRLFQRAWHEFGAACGSLPAPAHGWNVAGWLFAALGECAWQLGDFELAKKFLSNALNAPGAVGNEFVHLRFGQALHEVRDPRAQLELRRALDVGGIGVFELEDPIYRALATGGDITELLPSIPEQLFDDITARLDERASPHDGALEIAAVIVDLRQRTLVSSALAGERIGLVLASSPRPQAPGTLDAPDGEALEVRIDGVVHPRERIVLCRGLVREGALRPGARLRWRTARL